MSFFLDPPALFILGMLLYHFGRRFRWDQRATVVEGAFNGFLGALLGMG